LARILTPLIKFRACRDARRVTGDAMEVRGGCGYIEEWSDPRLVRDAHLGSIWEGTSNIVALDVVRAMRRDATLPAVERHLNSLLESMLRETIAVDAIRSVVQRTLNTARQVAEYGTDNQARQIATALYAAVTSVAMAFEAIQIRSPVRMALAQMVIRHRLMARDPLQVDS